LFTEEEYYDNEFRALEFKQEELMGVRFYDCTFISCDFSETRFRDCKFSGCTFEGCNLNMIQVLDCEIADARFTGCRLLSVNWTEASWPKIKRAGVLHMEECALNHSTFIGLALPRSVMRNCMAKDVDFRDANFSESDFTHTDFNESLFSATNLEKADFSHARNFAIDPGQNTIRKAKFTMPEATALLYAMDIQIVED